VVLVGGVCPARALTTPVCLAKKLNEWGKLRKCEATENGRTLQARPGDPAKCQTRFDAKLATLSALAKAAAIPCRYHVNGDGTVTDFDTGLQWSRRPTTERARPGTRVRLEPDIGTTGRDGLHELPGDPEQRDEPGWHDEQWLLCGPL
jgi:hypothetical protein